MHAVLRFLLRRHSTAQHHPSIRPPVSTICFVNLQKFTNFDHVDTPINFLFFT